MTLVGDENFSSTAGARAPKRKQRSQVGRARPKGEIIPIPPPIPRSGIFWLPFQFDLHASRFPAIQAGANDCLVMTNSNFIEIPSSEGQSCELINADDIASFDYSPAMAREADIPVESTMRIRLKNGKSVVCRGLGAEALRAKLTDGC